MAKSYICVFDCETIPDASLLRRIYGYDGDDMDVSLQAFEAQKQVSGSEFLPIIYHRVVAISAVMADEYGRFLRVSTMKGENEREILTKFITFINEHNPRLVSFNGRGFDLPMIMARAMRYNISASAYYETDNKELNKDKWKNYRSRYDGRFHLDLLDHISDFGAVRGLKLDALCASLNIPGKYDVSGDQVLELFYQNEIEKINEYCESDVLNTYWVFLKFELLQGNILLSDYANCLSIMSEYLDKNCQNRGYVGVFCEYISKEIDRLSGNASYEDEQADYKYDEDFQKVDIKNIDEHLAKSGLDGLLQKGVNAPLKSKPKAVLTELNLPEIDLDAE
ncbi:hypothetical protein LMG7974_00697 [Campylobacter majalis]|uniref:Predicted 3'-5' exonuclease PolB-like domain-containing protein n=1 Tax=Campylobacter majalis TaxID=2790656 RepID=A0ABM8Q4L2_9BACT|nr:3'-5' exonuclease [Campylobacter majalis]CAD7287809.1 hypothetical protein LMG7974_00697 [Campylobacter majalis]